MGPLQNRIVPSAGLERLGYVYSHLQSWERSFSSASVKIGVIAIDFDPVDTFDEKSISLLEPFGLFCYFNLYN